MKEKLMRIIVRYGVIHQLKYMQSEMFEFVEAVINYENSLKGLPTYALTKEEYKKHIEEELADLLVMLNQFRIYYNLNDDRIKEIMKYKIDRQLDRIKQGE